MSILANNDNILNVKKEKKHIIRDIKADPERRKKHKVFGILGLIFSIVSIVACFFLAQYLTVTYQALVVDAALLIKWLTIVLFVLVAGILLIPMFGLVALGVTFCSIQLSINRSAFSIISFVISILAVIACFVTTILCA